MRAKTAGISLHTTSRKTPPKIPVITPINEAITNDAWAARAYDAPVMVKRPSPSASGMRIAELAIRALRRLKKAITASAKMPMTYR